MNLLGNHLPQSGCYKNLILCLIFPFTMFSQDFSVTGINSWTQIEHDRQLMNQEYKKSSVAQNISWQSYAVFQKTSILSTDIEDPALSLTQAPQKDADASYEKQFKKRLQYIFSSVYNLTNWYGTKIAITITIGFIGATIFILLWIPFVRYTRSEPYIPSDISQIPHPMPPALVSFLATRQMYSYPVAATLFDLCRRGWYEIKHVEMPADADQPHFEVHKGRDRDEQYSEALREWEQDLVTYIDDCLKEGKQNLVHLFSEGSPKTFAALAEPTSVKLFKSSWSENLNNALDRKEWYHTNIESITGDLRLGLWLMYIFALVCLFMESQLGFIVPLAIISLLLPLHIALLLVSARTVEGQNEYDRWKVYERALRNPDGQKWENASDTRPLIYAVALGLPKEELKELADALSVTDSTIDWFTSIQGPLPDLSFPALVSELGPMGYAAAPGRVYKLFGDTVLGSGHPVKARNPSSVVGGP